MRILCESIEKGTAKTGSEFLKVSCACEDKAKRMFYLWDGVAEFENAFASGAKVFECAFGGDANFPKISSFVPAEGAPSEFYDFVYPNDDFALQVMDSLIGSISSEFYKALIDRILNRPGTNGYETLKQTFMVIPAAKAYHHDFRYGLLRHTHEVMSFVSRVCSSDLFAGSLDKDLALAGAFLHDVGKCYEYSFDGVNSAGYGTDLSVNQIYLASHLYKGAEVVAVEFENWVMSDPAVDTVKNRLKVEHLKHVILSHHLQREWAAVPKAPQTLEAYLVFLADYFSAAFGKFSALDWSNVSPENLFGATSKFDSFFGFTPLLKKLGAAVDG